LRILPNFITADCAISIVFTAVPVGPASKPVGAPTLSAWALYLLTACIGISAFFMRYRCKSFG